MNQIRRHIPSVPTDLSLHSVVKLGSLSPYHAKSYPRGYLASAQPILKGEDRSLLVRKQGVPGGGQSHSRFMANAE